MWSLLLLVAGSSAPVDFQTPDTAVVAVLSPFGSTEEGLSELTRAASKAIEARTRLRATSLEQLGLSGRQLVDCKPSRRVACWLALMDGAQVDAGVLLVLTVSPEDAERRLSAIAFDLEEARTLRQSTSPESFEEAIFKTAARGEVALPPGELGQALAHLLDADLQPLMNRLGHWGSPTEVRLAAFPDCDPCRLSIDDRAVTSVGKEGAVVRHLSPERHVFELRVEDRPRWSCAVQVAPGESALSVEQCVDARPPRSYALVWSGSAVAAVGVALTIGAILRPPPSGTTCVTRGPACDGTLSLQLPDIRRHPDWLGSAGVAVTAGGVGLAVASLWAAPDRWWVPALVGVLSAAAGFSVTAALWER